jgi:DnaJ domain
MNYYEELGLTPEATPAEIHQAHRKLTKLLHPDQQTDETLRRLAEAQMRRLNSIVDVLSDSDRRRQYDKGVNGAIERPQQASNTTNLGMTAVIEEEQPRRFLTMIRRYVPWWVWSTVGALTLTSAAVWFFADNLGSSFDSKTMAYVPVQDPPSQSVSGASLNPPAAAGNRESRAEARLQQLTAQLRGVFETKPGKPPAAEPRDSRGSPEPPQKELSTVNTPAVGPEQKPQPAPPAVAPPKVASHSEAASDTEAVTARLTPPKGDAAPAGGTPPSAQIASSPKLAPPPQSIPSLAPNQNQPNAPAVASPPASVAPAEILATSSGLEGEWIYAPKKPEKRKPGLYPPDFIELRLFRSQGALRGIYHARYQVDEARQISPEVSFQLSSQEENAKTLVWESANGSKGWLKVNPVDRSTIKVQWQTTVYSREPSLTAGVATLIRR